MTNRILCWLAASMTLYALGAPALVVAQQKMPAILDTDIGSDMDDAFALALLVASPEIELRGVTTSGSESEVRAWIVCRFLTAVGRKTIPVAAGALPQPERKIEGQFQYRYHPAVIFNRTAKPIKQDAVEFLYQHLKADPGKITILTTGPLTNIARLLDKHPDCKPWIKRLVISGGIMPAKSKMKQDDANIWYDYEAAKAVVAAGVPLTIVAGSQAASPTLTRELRKQIFKACTPLTFQLQALYQLSEQIDSPLADAHAAAFCISSKSFGRAPARIEVTKNGFLYAEGKPNGEFASIPAEDFKKWFLPRLVAGEAALPKAPPNPAQVIPADKFPNRVHAFEDYETNIEKRWWMSGVLETANVPPGSKRACRGVLTQDFDDLQGDMKTMYTAVIFNPVPGPPMGKQPRLSFRYWLKGTDTLRVQIYSLTKGYHRCLTLKGLPQAKWQSATVDMTHVRRPDGTGGPLSENERIDDVQFYVDPRADLIIDDMVLYDAPVPNEQRPFPRKILFTGLFDTGKQGKEWPGTFEIVKNGYFWNAAKSVASKVPGSNELRVGLRGSRPLGDATELFFRYRLAGTDTVEVRLHNKSLGTDHIVPLKGLKKGEWAETTINFSTDSVDKNGTKLLPRSGDLVDEVSFWLGAEAELLVDDLLLYEPGKK
jgi:inosine-uridine nucleoside N-ribohydrolase